MHILRQEFGNDWADKVKVIWAGDDTTDEDAMKVISTLIDMFAGKPNEFDSNLHLQALKGTGMSFRVSSNPDIETHADFRVPTMKSITSILQWLQHTMS